MKYRAKITHIEYWVKENLNVKNCFICHDSTDTYIEVDTEDEAILLEHANNLERKLQKLDLEYTMQFRHGSDRAIEYCNQVIRRVLEHYEPSVVIDCIMSDFEEITSTETE